MRPAFSVIQNTVFDWWNSMVGLAITNAIWLLASLTVVLFPPAIAGIYSVTYSMVNGTGQRPEVFWHGARQYAWLSFRWILANILIAILIFSNAIFYRDVVGGSVAVVAYGIIALLTLLWTIMQFYTWPFLMIQSEKHLRVALKNALFLTLSAPLYSLIMLFVVCLIVWFSLLTVLPLIFFCMSFLALLGNTAVVERLSTYDKLPTER